MIVKNSIQSTTGTNDSVAQSFAQNIFFSSTEGIITPFEFDVPQYSTIGGTKDYYGQNPLAIFTSLVKPFIRFDFSANTASFGPDVFIKHDIYRVTWDMFSSVQGNLKEESNKSTKTENIITETIEEVDEITGEVISKTITRTINEDKNVRDGHQKVGSLESRTIRPPFENFTNEDIQKQLDEPIYSVTAATTGITTNIYDFEIDEFIKNIGEFQTQLFQSRDQYIVDTNFIFNRNVTPGLTEPKTLVELEYQEDTSGVEVPLNIVDGTSETGGTYNSVITDCTTSGRVFIDRDQFEGIQFNGGDFFTYFEVPDKPILEYPSPTGQTDTFTPEIFWTNGENADEYLVQVTYNTGDTNFTGTVFTYIVPKSDEFLETAVSKEKDSTSEFSTSKAIRKYQLSLKSNSCLLYRVGNSNYIKNIFGIKQSVITFSDNKSMCTQTEPIKTFVYTESDSPYTPDIAGLSTPPSLESESPGAEYILSGTVTGSIVSGATMQLVYPNSSYLTVPTDTSGNFVFTELETGTYTLNTTYRGYAADSRQIVLSADTSVYFDIETLWSNDYDIWAIKESDTIKY